VPDNESTIETVKETDRRQETKRDSIDETAFEDLFRAYYPALVRYARRSISDETAGQDVVQEAFLRIWRNRQSIEEKQSIRTLLYLTVRNLIRNRYRDQARRKHLMGQYVIGSQVEHPSEAMQAGQLDSRIRAWIAALPERRREAFELSRYDGLTYKEIADVMDVSVKTVENHIRMALSDLRDRLRAYEPDLLRS